MREFNDGEICIGRQQRQCDGQGKYFQSLVAKNEGTVDFLPRRLHVGTINARGVLRRGSSRDPTTNEPLKGPVVHFSDSNTFVLAKNQDAYQVSRAPVRALWQGCHGCGGQVLGLLLPGQRRHRESHSECWEAYQLLQAPKCASVAGSHGCGGQVLGHVLLRGRGERQGARGVLGRVSDLQGATLRPVREGHHVSGRALLGLLLPSSRRHRQGARGVLGDLQKEGLAKRLDERPLLSSCFC